jgi:MFS family permease
MAQAATDTVSRDARIITLIGAGHACSHFFQLALPPLFFFIQQAFGVNNTELGLAMTCFYVASGLAQTPAGFLVDRFGARAILFAGLALVSAAVTLMGFVTAYWMLLPLAVLAGLGNSVFHPADYSILNASVGARRIGRAYGIHTFAGNIGWVVAPVYLSTLAWYFSWRGALIGAGSLGFAILAILIANRRALHYEKTMPRPAAAGASASPPSTAAVLLSAPILLCFGYFLLLSIALVGVQTFLPKTLDALHQTPIAFANLILTGFLIGSSVGILVGGFLADRLHRHDVIVAGGLAAAAAMLILIGTSPLSNPMLFAVITITGFLSGITTPSRDMLVRGATPRGSAGKVFGFVYSGLDAGSAVAPLAIGRLLDHQQPGLVFWMMALALAAAIFTAVALKRNSPAPVAVPAE